jgi:hypothetical protein
VETSAKAGDGTPIKKIHEGKNLSVLTLWQASCVMMVSFSNDQAFGFAPMDWFKYNYEK